MKRILIRDSRTPFENFYNGPIPTKHLLSVHRALGQPGTKNIGNLVFGHSVYKVLSAPDTELTIDKYGLSGDDTFADRADEINERYDAFVIPLCNSFRTGYRASVARMTRTIRRLRIPCIVTGVGAQSSLDGSFETLLPMKDEVLDFVSAILDRSASISVRGQFTQDYLVQLGFPRDRVDVIGCPSMFYNGLNMNVQKKSDTLESISLNLSRVKRSALLKITGYFNEHTRNATYVPQVRDLMPDLGRGRLPKEGTPDTLEDPVPNLLREGKVKFFTEVVPWMDFMRTQSLAIGTRIHGNVVALLAGTPAHVIPHDSRTLELARYFEIPHTALRDIVTFDPQELYDRSDYTALNRNHPERVAIYAKFLEKNGLNHILYDEKRLTQHDERVRASLNDTILAKKEMLQATGKSPEPA